VRVIKERERYEIKVFIDVDNDVNLCQKGGCIFFKGKNLLHVISKLIEFRDKPSTRRRLK